MAQICGISGITGGMANAAPLTLVALTGGCLVAGVLQERHRNLVLDWHARQVRCLVGSVVVLDPSLASITGNSITSYIAACVCQ
jgi:hypothetical protein